MQWDDRIGRRLKLRDLHILLTVAQQGSMGKAAKHLAVSQPVVSKAISDMERMLKVRLLDRTAHGIEPTIYGGTLLRWGTVVFDDLKRSITEIEFLADPTAGEVRIASAEAMNAGLVPAVIDRLSRQFPRLVFNIFQGQLELLYRTLRERSVDLIVVPMGTPIEDEDLNVDILFDNSLFVVAAANSKWLRRRKIEPSELIDEPWCLPMHGRLATLAITRAFRANGLEPPRRTVSTNSVRLFDAMVATGRFLSVASMSRLRMSGKRPVFKAVPVELQIPFGTVGIVTLKNRTISPVAQLFIDCAHKLARPLAKGERP